MKTEIKRHFYMPYLVMMVIYAVFLVVAFALDSPREILEGLSRIIRSRSVLVTDYIEVGGIGAALVNSVMVGCSSIFLMVRSGIKPNGAIMMAVWLSTGFAFFGKNIFNMLPITFGVWLFSKYHKEPFMNYALASLLSATLSPVVSELAFNKSIGLTLGVLWGFLLGVFVGFIFPTISSSAVKAHSGYCLYNMGFAGGLIATVIMSVMKSVGIEVESESIWCQSYNFEMAVMLYAISIFLIITGVVLSEDRRSIPKNLRRMLGQSGRLVTDFYFIYKESVYINMGVLCILSTTAILVLGGDLSGATIGGIFTVVGFGSFGKHVRNVLPLMVGAVASTYFNRWDPVSPANTLAILFSTGLAPIAGEFGWIWGIVAGFVHVNLATHVGSFNSGMNLYNNGFAGGLVAMMLVPLILTFRREKDSEI